MALFFSFHPVRKAPFCPSAPAISEEDALLLDKAVLVQEYLPPKDAAMQDIRNNRVMAAVSYLGPLCLLPYFSAHHSPFAHRHAVRGLNLFLTACLYFFCTGVLEHLCSLLSWQLGLVFSAARFSCALVFPVLSVYGCRIALRGESKKLPLVGRIRFVRR